MAQGLDDGLSLTDSSNSRISHLSTVLSEGINETGVDFEETQFSMAPLDFGREVIVTNRIDTVLDDPQNCESLSSSRRKRGIGEKESPLERINSESGTSSNGSSGLGQLETQFTGVNNVAENSPSSSGLKGILKHRHRRKSDGNIDVSNSNLQSSDVTSPDSILIRAVFENEPLDPTRRESVPCIRSGKSPHQSFSTMVPSSSNESAISFNSSPNRNVEFELKDERGARELLNGECSDVRTAPVVITVSESGGHSGDDGVIRVPIRTKKGILKKRSKSTESLPKRNSIRFSDYEDEIIFNNQDELTMQADPVMAGPIPLHWNRQRKASLQESYSNRSLDTQAISDELKSILKTSNSKGRESLPSSSEELCGILKRTCPNDSEGGPFSLSDSGSQLKMKGILKTQASSEDSSRYSSLEDVDCSVLERAQSVPAENNRSNPYSAHLAVNGGYTHPSLINSTQLKGILRVDGARRVSAETTPLVSAIVSPEKSGSEIVVPSFLTYEQTNHRDSNGSSLYSSVENSSSSCCYSRSDSCGSQGSRPQSSAREIKVRSILKNSNRSANRKEKRSQITSASSLSKSLTFDPGYNSGMSNGVAKTRITFPDNHESFHHDVMNGMINADVALDGCLHQSSSCTVGSGSQQPVKSILRSSANTGTPYAQLSSSSMHVPSSNASATSFTTGPFVDDDTTSHSESHGAMNNSQINSDEPQIPISQFQPSGNLPQSDENGAASEVSENYERRHFNQIAFQGSDADVDSNAAGSNEIGSYGQDIEDDESISFLPSVDPDESYDEDE